MEPTPEPQDAPPEAQPVAKPPEDQFTLEEWIASTQACCGVSPPDED